jgi:hypothetical protein
MPILSKRVTCVGDRRNPNLVLAGPGIAHERATKRKTAPQADFSLWRAVASRGSPASKQAIVPG